jgi:hypothetical protein
MKQQVQAMNDREQKRDQARQWIVAACEALSRARSAASPFSRPVFALEEDGFALLADASGVFCSSLSHVLDHDERSRWMPALPQLLLAHPERCEEILDSLERGCLDLERELAAPVA